VRVRLLVAPLVVIAAAVLAPGALAATSPHFGADGCDHSKPPAFGSKKPFFAKPGTVLKPGAKATIVMVTSCGALRIALAQDKNNAIPNSIAFLVTKHYFDGLAIFRAVPDFVLQGGSPFNNGTRGPGYTVVGKVPAGYRYKVGDVAMAKTQVDPSGTAGSQFFLVSGPAGAQLPTDYGLLGHATDRASLATIKRLARFAVDPNPPSAPLKPLYIWTAKLVSG
jgi:cyclophilin family peptidyl-prolyl cis-trans isomerase